MIYKKEDDLKELQDVKAYFLSIQESDTTINNNELLNNLTKITTAIIFDTNTVSRKTKINFLIFWINYLIDEHSCDLTNELKTSIGNIISNLDLYQLSSYISDTELQDNNLIFANETRKILGNEITLTDCQIDILFSVLENKNIIFSAPTSYGKSSIIINSIFIRLMNKEINNVVFIIPSKALINEYRKKFNKLMKSFNCAIDINENPYITLNKNQHIHLFTQERLLIFDQINEVQIDYVVFDEVQELLAINKENPERAVLLAKAISIFENKNTPMIFLMPYIQNPEDEFINYFTNTKFVVKKDLYSPTTSNKYLIVKENNKFQLNDVTLNKGFSNIFEQHEINIEDVYPTKSFYDLRYDFYKICQSLNIINEKSLCYCNKSNLSSIANEFQKSKQKIRINDRLNALIKYLKNYVHPNFELISFLEKGLAIHHADLDNFTKRQIEECFKDPNCDLNMIFCTSTLLQGVNLNANNLFFLAPKGNFTNSELDKKNLFGRVGRIGSKLQGNIFKFWVEGQRTKKETEANELNSANDQYIVEDKKLTIDSNKLKTDEFINSYYKDKDIKKKLRISTNIKMDEQKLDNFDYFIGKSRSDIIDKKIKNMTDIEKQNLENKMKFSSREDCEYVINKLCGLYDWKKSLNYDEKYRMTNIDYITTVFYNNYLGRSIKNSVNDMIKTSQDENSDFVLAILKKTNNELYPKFLYKHNYKDNPRFVRLYEDKDINILIYSYIYETQNIIEFRVKKYLQDLYYRLLKSQGRSLQSMEDYLIYSTANNNRKINLNKLGLLDSFAIDELIENNDLFKNDIPIFENIIKYAESLENDNPLKYAVLDVLQ